MSGGLVGFAITVMLVAAGEPAAAAPSPEVQAFLAPVADAIEAARRENVGLPPATTDAERLIRLGRLDQAPRYAIGKLDFSKLSPADRVAAREELRALIEPVDRANLAEIERLMPDQGWFTFSVYGEEGARAAFHIVQHADDATRKRVLPLIEPLVAKGEADGRDYAKLYDRVAMNEGRPQRYGTQFRCEDGRYRVYKLEDPAKVEQLRREVGEAPLAELEAAVAKMPACG